MCIPHLPGFWDRVLVGRRPPPDIAFATAKDPYLPRLFGVDMEIYALHWCCFVLRKQVILALWCTKGTTRAEGNEGAAGRGTSLVPLYDPCLRDKVREVPFKRMLHFLREWFLVQYCNKRALPLDGKRDSCSGRELHVVLDCKPSEALTLKHLIVEVARQSGTYVFTSNDDTTAHTVRNRSFFADENMILSNASAIRKMFEYDSRSVVRMAADGGEDERYVNLAQEYEDQRLTQCIRTSYTTVSNTACESLHM